MKSFLKHLGLYVTLLSLSFSIRHMVLNLQLRAFPNSAFIFGLFNETSYFVRIVTTSVLLGIVVILACYFYAFLSQQLRLLRWGMTVLLAGISGNAFEKLFTGFVLDYLSLPLPGLDQFFFNLNDGLQLTGLAIIIREIFVKQNVIWFPDPLKRKTLIVNREVQVPVTTKILGLFFISSLTQGVLAMALLFPQLKRGSQDVQVLFILCLLVLNLALLPLIGRFLLRELLRCVGPVFALEKFLKSEDPSKTNLKFRSSDHFRSLEGTFNNFIERHFKSK